MVFSQNLETGNFEVSNFLHNLSFLRTHVHILHHNKHLHCRKKGSHLFLTLTVVIEICLRYRCLRSSSSRKLSNVFCICNWPLLISYLQIWERYEGMLSQSLGIHEPKISSQSKLSVWILFSCWSKSLWSHQLTKSLRWSLKILVSSSLPSKL